MKDKKVYKLSPKTRRRMSAAHKGKKHSPETIAKIRAAKLERDALVAQGLLPRYRHSPETRALLRRKALKQRKRHKLSPKDRKLAAQNRVEAARDKRMARKLAKLKWE